MSHPLVPILKTISRTSCPYHINFHCHTIFSDGSMDPIDLIKQASKLGIKHIAITDHHTTHGYKKAHEWIEDNLTYHSITPELWSGIEISCLIDKCLVHVLGLGFDVNHPSLHKYSCGESPIGEDMQAANVMRAIHQAGGLAFLAHPARYRIPFNVLLDKIARLGFDGAETWYDYNFLNKWSYTPFICDQVDIQLGKLSLLRSCGTDSHGHSLLSR